MRTKSYVYLSVSYTFFSSFSINFFFLNFCLSFFSFFQETTIPYQSGGSFCTHFARIFWQYCGCYGRKIILKFGEWEQTHVHHYGNTYVIPFVYPEFKIRRYHWNNGIFDNSHRKYFVDNIFMTDYIVD